MARNLPTSGTPLTLANGVVLEASPPPKPQTRISVPAASEAQRLVSSTRRKLTDLPGLPKQMNAVAALLVYTAIGLSDEEIAVATGVKLDQLLAIRDSAAYQDMERYVIGSVKEQTASDVKSILTDAELAAARGMAKMVDDIDPKIAFAARKDILDRGGHTAAQKVDIRQQMMSTLRIEVVDKREAGKPVIDMEMEP